MASGIFLILDDIAMLADDVAIATKIATTKTAGILGDDIAVAAQKSTGFKEERELKIIWAITKGSLKNKIIILPIAFLLSIFAPYLIPYILIAGAFYLLYEGVEKIEEYIHSKLINSIKVDKKEIIESTADNILDIENKKIKSAIFTDFILSIEIIIIALSSVLKETIMIQIVATSAVAILATFGVYGLVALIVRIDDVGFWLLKKEKIKSGNFLIALMPKIIKVLTVVGTIAMILVGGDILIHNIDFLHQIYNDSTIINSLFVGLIGGIIALVIIKIFAKLTKINKRTV